MKCEKAWIRKSLLRAVLDAVRRKLWQVEAEAPFLVRFDGGVTLELEPDGKRLWLYADDVSDVAAHLDETVCRLVGRSREAVFECPSPDQLKGLWRMHECQGRLRTESVVGSYLTQYSPAFGEPDLAKLLEAGALLVAHEVPPSNPPLAGIAWVPSLVLACGWVPEDGSGVQGAWRVWHDAELAFERGEPVHAREGTVIATALEAMLLQGDKVRAQLPALERSVLTDPEKGLWELLARPPQTEGWHEVTLPAAWEVRDPAKDVRSQGVAIDFGTSSTVVALRDAHGNPELLRVGVQDWQRAPIQADYENPSAIRFLSWAGLQEQWRSEPYQPRVKRNSVELAHIALDALRDHEATAAVVAGILTGLKQWPLRAEADGPLRLADATGGEFQIPPSLERCPVKGVPLAVTDEDPFDPIELYAYYLGLSINKYGRGLYLKYYMTFPVAYPQIAKRRIEGAFARGLQRSLPPSLLEDAAFARFEVKEWAAEPVAYAACALEAAGVPLAAEGAAYAVFDFGGGTTDFDFGVYRAPTEAEAEDYTQVIERFAASGDRYLGGEHLIDHLAYLTFLANLEACRQHQIPFTLPPGAKGFAGSEQLIDQSRSARANANKLASALREVWEKFDDDGVLAAGTLKLTLCRRDGENETVQLKVDRPALETFLIRRLTEGVLAFLLALRTAFRGRAFPAGELHILLAGNASKSVLLQGLFHQLGKAVEAAPEAAEGVDAKKALVGVLGRIAGRGKGSSDLLLATLGAWGADAGGSDRARRVRECVREACQEVLGLPATFWSEDEAGDPPARGLLGKAFRHIFGADVPPEVVLHAPLPEDPTNPNTPTGKTGVAIGLLDLLPGRGFKVIAEQALNKRGEAPFKHFVGAHRPTVVAGERRTTFHPMLCQGAPYMAWQELGRPNDGVFTLVYSTATRALEKTIPQGSSEALEEPIYLEGDLEGRRFFAQALDPDTIEVCTARSLEEILSEPDAVTNKQRIRLR